MNQNQAVYQGHLPDGSGIQKHSAGGLYPCVLFLQNTERGPKWGVIRGMVDTGPVFPEHESAVAFGELLNGMARIASEGGDALELRVKLALNEWQPFAEVLAEHHDRAAVLVSLQAVKHNAHPNITSAVAAMAYYLWRDQKYLAALVAPKAARLQDAGAVGFGER